MSLTITAAISPAIQPDVQDALEKLAERGPDLSNEDYSELLVCIGAVLVLAMEKQNPSGLQSFIDASRHRALIRNATSTNGNPHVQH